MQIILVVLGAVIILAVLLAIPVGVVLGVYFAFRKKPTKAIWAFIITVTAFLILPEGRFYPYPLIDTTRSEKFTIARFESVTVGMSRSEVEERIGSRASTYDTEVGFGSCERQTDDGAFKYWDFAWYNATICYDVDDRVISANSYWQQD